MACGKLPGAIADGWKSIRIGPDGKPDFPVGAPCHIGRPTDQPRKTCRLKLGASLVETVASGMRER